MSSVIDMLKRRSAENVSQQLEEAKKDTGRGFAEEVEMKHLYDARSAKKGKDIGFVRLRLLPNKHNETGEFVKDIVPSRSFFTRTTSLEEFKREQQGTKWYIALSRVSLNAFSEFKDAEDKNTDPMQEYLNSIYEMHTKEGGSREDETIYSKYYKALKARQTYVVNAYIEECPAHPELEGTVKAFKFGPGIYKEITKALEEQTLGSKKIPPIDVFNPLSDTGASLMIRVHNEKGDTRFVEYEAAFDSCDPLMINGAAVTEEQTIELIEKTHDLFKIYITDQVKTYEQLVKYFKSQFGFAHDKYTRGSEFQEALKEEVESQVPNNDDDDVPNAFGSGVPKSKQEKPLEDVSNSGDSGQSLLDKFRERAKAQQTS